MSNHKQAAGEENPIGKNITVVMPYEGDAGHDDDADTPKRQSNRLYKLIYWRFKHIIESKINYIMGKGPGAPRNPNPVRRHGKPCQFNVSAVVTRRNAKLLDVMGPITSSDIAVGFVTHTNETVVSLTLIYELAVRQLLRSALVLVIDGVADELRPQFMSSLKEVVVTPSWMEDQTLRNLAKDYPLRPLDDFEPGDADKEAWRRLEGISDSFDDGVTRELRRAIQAMMDGENPQSDEVRHLMRELDPEYMVSTASVFYPAQIVKISWAERPRDARGRPVPRDDSHIIGISMCDWNQPFLDLFNLDANTAEQEGTVGDDDIVAFLKEHMDPDDYERYLEDQNRLWKLIVLGPQAGVAAEPIIFNSTHPNPNLRNRAFLPCCVLKKRMGDPAQEHFIYLLVVFFDVTGTMSLKNPALIGQATRMASDPDLGLDPTPTPADGKPAARGH